MRPGGGPPPSRHHVMSIRRAWRPGYLSQARDTKENQHMNTTRRAWRIPAAAALAGALLGTGITAGALADGPAAASSTAPAASSTAPAASSTAPAASGPAAGREQAPARAAGPATHSYAPVVRQ